MYLVYGMTPEQFWKGEPELAVAYREAYKLRNDEQNALAWLHGIYTQDALIAVTSTVFARKKKDIQEYPSMPKRLSPLTEVEKAQEKQRALDSAIEQLNLMKSAWDNKHG